jgi:hypothetical protein
MLAVAVQHVQRAAVTWTIAPIASAAWNVTHWSRTSWYCAHISHTNHPVQRVVSSTRVHSDAKTYRIMQQAACGKLRTSRGALSGSRRFRFVPTALQRHARLGRAHEASRIQHHAVEL